MGEITTMGILLQDYQRHEKKTSQKTESNAKKMLQYFHKNARRSIRLVIKEYIKLIIKLRWVLSTSTRSRHSILVFLIKTFEMFYFRAALNEVSVDISRLIFLLISAFL